MIIITITITSITSITTITVIIFKKTKEKKLKNEKERKNNEPVVPDALLAEAPDHGAQRAAVLHKVGEI